MSVHEKPSKKTSTSIEDLEKAAAEQVAGKSDTQPTPIVLTNDPGPTPTVITDDPGPTPARNIRISNFDWSALIIEAKNEGTSAGAIVRRLIRRFLKDGE